MTEKSDIANSEIVAKAGREIIDSLADMAEASFDSSAVELIFDEILVIKTITDLYKAGLSIREGLFAKKLQDFLKAASRTTGPTGQEREQAIMSFGGRGK
jgi:urease alpha subunit